MNRISKLRSEMGMSQVDLAKKLGIHQTAISQWESERTSPRFDMLEAMSKIFNVSIRYLLGQSEERTEPLNNKTTLWDVDLENKLSQVGYSAKFQEDQNYGEFYCWIEGPEGKLEVSEDELKELHNSTNEYMRFKLEELKKKHAQDFRPKGGQNKT